MLHSKLTLTLLTTLLLSFTLLSVSEAKGFDVHRRDHESLKRFVRKRSPLPDGVLGGGLIPNGSDDTPVGVGADPSGITASLASTTTATTASASTSAATSAESSSASASASSSTDSSAGSSSIATSSSASSVSSSAASSSSSSVPSTSSTEPTQTAATDAPADSNTAVVLPNQTITRTATASSTATSGAAQDASGATSTSAKSISLTIVIVILSIAAGVTILWTVFRKWKLSSSSDFDKRMQPINWAPTGAEDDVVPGLNRVYSTSSQNGSSSHGHEGYGATSDRRLPPIPDHDFTAGPSTLAPVGGYADLARGPSPQPQMQELSRGPSMRSDYDQYGGVPLHHQAGYGNRY